MKSSSLQSNQTAVPSGTTSQRPVALHPEMWVPAARSPAKKSLLPARIQPPQSNTGQTCKGALHAATSHPSDMRMTAPIKSMSPSLLAAGSYHCAAGKGSERHYTFIALRDTRRRP